MLPYILEDTMSLKYFRSTDIVQLMLLHIRHQAAVLEENNIIIHCTKHHAKTHTVSMPNFRRNNQCKTSEYAGD